MAQMLLPLPYSLVATDMNEVHYSSSSDDWETPQILFDALDQEFKFTLDPCASITNAKCKKFYTLDDDGLSKSWKDERVFMNPPYGRQICDWVKKAYLESSHALVVCLLPARTDTSYWHDYIFGKAEVRFMRGRVYFNSSEGKTGPAPFPSAIVIYNKERDDR